MANILKSIGVVLLVIIAVVIGAGLLKSYNNWILVNNLKKSEQYEKSMVDSLVALSASYETEVYSYYKRDSIELHRIDSLQNKISSLEKKKVEVKQIVAQWSDTKIDSLFETYELPLPDTEHDTTYCFGAEKCKIFASAYIQQPINEGIIESQKTVIEQCKQRIAERDTIIENKNNDIVALKGAVSHEQKFAGLKDDEIKLVKKQNRHNAVKKFEWATIAIAAMVGDVYLLLKTTK